MRGYCGGDGLYPTARGQEPRTVTKLRGLLGLVGERLNLSCETGRTRARARAGARARLLALRFALKLRVVYGARAVARARALRAVARGDRPRHPRADRRGRAAVRGAELAADEALGGAVDMEQ